MKSRFELSGEDLKRWNGNNWLKMHGYAMYRSCGKRNPPKKLLKYWFG